MVSFMIGDKTFKVPDSNGIPLFCENADPFTLVLLRANSAADGWKGIPLPDFSHGSGEISLLDMLDKGGNIDGHGASSHA
jgi:hypothetical protein